MILKVQSTTTRLVKPDEIVDVNNHLLSINVEGKKTKKPFMIREHSTSFRTKNGKSEITITGTLENCSEEGKSVIITLQ